MSLYTSTEKIPRNGFIAAIEEQTNKLADARTEMFAREAKSKDLDKAQDPIAMHIKHFNPRLMDKKENAQEKKTYRIRNILHEKRETIIDFIDKKRDIYLAKLNIVTKKEETNRLEDFIKNEQESLKARQLYFKNDCELVKKFMDEVKYQAEAATILADKEVKKKEEVKTEVTRINAANDMLRQQKNKLKEEFEKLKNYKDFIENLKDTHKSKFMNIDDYHLPQKQLENPMFVTQVLEQEEDKRQDKMAHIMIDILSNMEENNLRHIQNERDTEAEIELQRNESQKREDAKVKAKEANKLLLGGLGNQLSAAQQTHQQLHKLDRIDQTKLSFVEGQDLDMEKIGKKIIEIHQEIAKKEEPKKIIVDSRQVRLAMAEIEKLVMYLLNQKKLIWCEANRPFTEKFEKNQRAAKNKQRQTNAKDEEKRNMTIKRRQKKDEYLAKFNPGRPDRKRHYYEQIKKQVEEVEEVDVNDDNKYLEEKYELGQEVKKVKPIIQQQE